MFRERWRGFSRFYHPCCTRCCTAEHSFSIFDQTNETDDLSRTRREERRHCSLSLFLSSTFNLQVRRFRNWVRLILRINDARESHELRIELANYLARRDEAFHKTSDEIFAWNVPRGTKDPTRGESRREATRGSRFDYKVSPQMIGRDSRDRAALARSIISRLARNLGFFVAAFVGAECSRARAPSRTRPTTFVHR